MDKKKFQTYLIVLLFIEMLFGTNEKVFASLKPFSLQEAIHFALENSPAFDTAKKTQSIRELEYKSALAKLLPSMDFTTTNGLQNNIPIASTSSASPVLTSNPTAPWYSSLNLGVTESLYDNGISLTNLSIANLNRDLALISYFKSRDSLTLAVASEFYRFSLASILLQVRKQQQSILEKQFKTLSSQYQQGFKTKNDYLRLKTQVQRAEIDRVTAENNLTLSVTELHKTLGVHFQDSNPPLFDPITVQDRKLETYFPQKPPAIEKAYDYQIAKLQEQVNEKTVLLTKRKYWPQIALTSGITYNNQNYLNSKTSFTAGNQLSWNALITLQYNLWDWGTRNRDVSIAEYNRNIQENSIHQNLLDVNSKIIGIMADISRISKNYKLSNELLSLEEESYRNLETQYREGKVMYLDLITSLNNLLDAKVQFYTAYFDSLQTISKYKFYEGKIYETVIQK